LVKPRNENRSVPIRPANSELRTREYLTAPEVDKLIKAARDGRYGHRDATLILVAFRHGLRAVEICDLEWSQVEFGRSASLHVRRAKNGKPSVHPLRGDEVRALRELRRQYSDSGFVFATERLGPFTPDGVNRLIKRIGERAKLPFQVHAHMLRHGCGYALANAGHDTRAIQDWLGHRSIQHTRMKLTLRFRGDLPSNGGPEEKHAIRLQLHSQLEAFWQKDSRLEDISKNLKGLQVPTLKSSRFEVTRPIKGAQNFFWRHPLCGHNFVPLVTGVRESHCHLSLRFYRRTEDEGILFDGGDIDNRLKTFFDALQVPQSSEQIPPSSRNPKGDSNEWPTIFCLVDNDRSITKLAIESFILLTAIPSDCKRPENYAEIDIDVEIVPVTPMQGSLDLLFP